MIPFNSLSAVLDPYRDEIIEEVNKVIKSGWYISGPKVEKFEEQFSEYLHATNTVSVANGTDAIEIALRALGVKSGDEVITVANAGGYTTTACMAIGAIPVYVDVNDYMLISNKSVRAMITENTKAIVATHLYGQAADIDQIKQVSAGIPILEDCAQAHGAKFGNKMVGTLGDVATFSFYPTKNLGAIGDAGAIVTNDAALAEKAKMLRQYGWKTKYNSHLENGRNSRLDEIQAAVLSVMIKYIDEMNQNRKDILNEYRNAVPELFKNLKSGEENVVHLAVATVDQRDSLIEFLRYNNVSTDIHFPILDTDQAQMKNAHFVSDDLNKSRIFVNKIVSLPCYPNMDTEHVKYIYDLLGKFSDETN